MDVFIAEEAKVGLRAEALGPPPEGHRGLLLGHRRGPRFFVARVFPLGGRSFPPASRIRELNRLFDGRIIGYYSTRCPAPGLAGILQPFAYGKVFLRLHGTREGARGPAVRAWVIEYDKKFFLSPISLSRRQS
jgi:hypothetical protein